MSVGGEVWSHFVLLQCGQRYTKEAPSASPDSIRKQAMSQKNIRFFATLEGAVAKSGAADLFSAINRVLAGDGPSDTIFRKTQRCENALVR